MARRRGESTRAYFWQVFSENPQLLWERSNEAVLERWKQDHDQPEVPNNIKTSMANTKSEMRAEARNNGAAVRPIRSGRGVGLEELEIAIDSCLQLARQHAGDDLLPTIKLLRQARNGVVLAGG